jgi:membrane-bound lytic murein transglycosylase D
VRAAPRLSAHFDRLVDRISALELTALATGDGFVEATSEPASIDALLALSELDVTAPPPPDLLRTVEADLAATSHDVPIPLNDRVLRYVELFQGRLREFLTEGLNRGAAYLPMIQGVLRAEGLPLDLAYVPLVESAFKPTALSKASARGTWQFMQGTAAENGLRTDWYVDERANTDKATRAAAKYLKTLYSMFGDWHLALASYNGGPGRVQRALQRSRAEDFWTLSATTRHLPRETREYVPMILAAIVIARNPAQYGFELSPVARRAADLVNLPGPVDLRRVAEWTGVPVDEIRGLNPELRRWTTPPNKNSQYDLKVPAGTAQVVMDRYASAGPSEAATLQWYTVKAGDSMVGIARKFRVSRTDLAQANYLRVAAQVRPGQQLVIPRAPSGTLLASRAEPAETAPAAKGRPATARAKADAGRAVAASDEPTRVLYRVRSGDTLSAIARRHNVSIDDLKSWNRLRSSTLAVGTRLTILSNAPGRANNQ